MDEVSLFSQLRPEPPANAEEIRERARRRLLLGLATAGSPRPARAFRERRRWLVLTAATAAAAAAAIAVPALLPASAGSFVTPAWAVQRSADGTITVTLRKTLTHQAELQRVLRADGVPAYVRSMAGCQFWEPQGGIKQIQEDSKAMLYPAPGNNDRNFSKIIIHPAALPKGDAVFIAGQGPVPHGPAVSLQLFVMRNNRPPVCMPGQSPRAVSNGQAAHGSG